MGEKRGLFSRVGGFLEGFRRFVLNAITLLIIVMILVVIFADRGEPVPAGSALVLSPSGMVVEEYSLLSPLEQLQRGDMQREVLLSDLQTAVSRAKNDDRIQLLVLSFNELDHIGISKSAELIPVLEEFKASGKPILAVADYFDQDDYFVAAHANEIYTHPLGGVLIEGFAIYNNYFREALDKMSVQMEVFRVGEYKSALEPYMRSDMSAEARAASQSLIDQLWQQYSERVTAARGIKAEQLEYYVNQVDKAMEQVGGDTARMAANANLVDGIVDHGQWRQLLESRVGTRDGELNSISMREYLRATKSAKEEAPGKVAVVVVAGTIMPGESAAGTAGGDTIVERVTQAMADDEVKAVVLRIDSPGGSVFASEQIRNQLAELRETGKPLVVSMGSVAASGGYWIAAEADEIFALPSTLTGSIGVFGAFPILADTLENLGIYTDGVSTSRVAGSMRIDRPLSEVARRSIQSGVEFSYAKFLDIVAQGRGISVEEADEVARGRVWTGAEAQQLGLVDQMGGLKQAVAAAADRAGLSRYELEWMEDDLPAGLQIFQGLLDDFGYAMPTPMRAFIARLAAPLSTLQTFSDKRGIYALCLGCASL